MSSRATFDQLVQAVNDDDAETIAALVRPDQPKINTYLLKMALKEHDTDVMQKIIEKLDMSVDIVSCIQTAIKFDFDEGFKELLDFARKKKIPFDLDDFFYTAIFYDSLNVGIKILYDTDFDEDQDNYIFWKLVVEQNKKIFLKLMLEKLEISNVKKHEKNLYTIGVANNSIECIAELLKDNIHNPDHKDSYALKLAVCKDNLPMVKLLVEDGRVEISTDSMYCYWVALQENYQDVLLYLLSKNSNADVIEKVIKEIVSKKYYDRFEAVFALEMFNTLPNVDYAESVAEQHGDRRMIQMIKDQRENIPPQPTFDAPFITNQVCSGPAVMSQNRKLFNKFLKALKYDKKARALMYEDADAGTIVYTYKKKIMDGSFCTVYVQNLVGDVKTILIDNHAFEIPPNLALKEFMFGNHGQIEARIEKKILHLFEKYDSPCLNSRVLAAPIEEIQDQSILIVMEYMDGALNQIKFETSEIIKIIEGICRGLQCFRSINLMYSDLKPQNLLYRCEEGKFRIYFGDYGSGSVEKGYSLFTMVPFMAWPAKYYEGDDSTFEPNQFECKEWHQVFLLFMTSVRVWKDYYNAFSSQEFNYGRFDGIEDMRKAKILDEKLIKKYQRLLSDRPDESTDMRRLLHVLRYCFHARAINGTLSGVLKEIKKVETMY